MASLVDTAFIGHLGAVELAAAGVSIAIYNQASRITIFPLVSITTSFVAEEDTLEKMKMESMKVEGLETGLSDKLGYEMERTERNDILNHLDLEIDAATETGNNVKMFKHNVSNEGEENGAENDGDKKHDELRKDRISIEVLEASNTTMFKHPGAAVVPVDNKTEKPAKVVKHQKRHIASASTALIFGLALGLFQALFLMLGAKTLLRAMGVEADSPMLDPAHTYLVTRAIGAPAFLLALAMQGIFRGLKDTTTPLYVILGGYAINIAMDPILIFVLKFRIRGAAISHIFAQYLMAFVLFLILMRRVELVPPSLQVLYAQFGRFLKNGTLLLFRVVAVTFCVTLAASLAARIGTMPMAAFQACLQVWLTSSLLADGLAVGGQAILASAFAEKDYRKAQATATRVLQMSFVMGMALALIVGIGLYFGGGAFTSNVDVLRLIRIGLPFVAATQPINSLSFVFDGVNFGASDFAYCAYSLVMVSVATVATEFLLSRAKGFVGIWVALSIYMALRAFAGAWRMATGTGPWQFLRG